MTNVSEQTESERQGAELSARRRAQESAVDRYIRASLDDPDLLQAALGSTVGDLWETAMPIDREIKALLNDSGDGWSALEEISPALEMLIKVHRQAERYLQVAARRAALRPPTSEHGPTEESAQANGQSE
jgi:hypothetical protein